MPSMSEIKVKVVRRKGRRNLVFRWSDPVTGESGERTARTRQRREAYRRVPAFLEQLDAERRPPPEKTSWQEACRRYEEEHLVKRRESTRSCWRKARNRYQRAVEPKRLTDLDADGLSRFGAAVYNQLSPHSVDSYLRSLRAFSRWAARIFLDYSPPEITVRKSRSKGRPLVKEEVERLLLTCPSVKAIGDDRKRSWKFLILGLVHSGLRLGQALELSWEPGASIHVYGIDGRRPKMMISEESHKGKREQRIPLSPPMVRLLRKIPAENRYGPIFNPELSKGVTRSVVTVSAVICEIGRRAGIRVGTRLKRDRKTGEVSEVPRYAGAHDLKRTFVQRMIGLGLSPVDVSTCAQHASFSTTQQHYTDQNADRLADRIWAAYHTRMRAKGAKLGDTRQRGTHKAES